MAPKMAAAKRADGATTATVASMRRGKRRGQWSWLHATACSSAIVASGAYMHGAISEYLAALARSHEAARDDPASTSTQAAPTTTQAMPGVHVTSALVDAVATTVLPWRWLVVYVLLLVWLLALVVMQRLRLHRPLQRLGAHAVGVADKVYALSQRVWAQAIGSSGKPSGASGGNSAWLRRRLFSADLEIDDDDLLVVTSLSPARRHALPARARRHQQRQQQQQQLQHASPLSRSRESSEADEQDIEATSHDRSSSGSGSGRGDGDHLNDTEDAQILLHPRDGARGGRHHDNEIIVDDPYVSRYHFAIQYDALEKEYFLQDLGSTTGTFVFLKPDTPKRLAVDDRVKVGDTEFEVVAIDANATTGTPFLRLCFTDGPLRGVGQTIGRTAVTLGRRSSNALCITDDASISGRHSVIAFLGDGFYLTDLHSTNGTALRLSASGVKSARRYLLHGDVFGVGANRFLVEYAHELEIQERQQQQQQQEVESRSLSE